MDCHRLRRSPLPLVVAFLVGCGGISDTQSKGDTAGLEDQVCDQLDQTQVAVITEMWFARVSDDGVSAGADLDQSEGGCGVDDFENLQGSSGVDNSFGTMIPILELTEGAGSRSEHRGEEGKRRRSGGGEGREEEESVRAAAAAGTPAGSGGSRRPPAPAVRWAP